jgi:hypothetical protein
MLRVGEEGGHAGERLVSLGIEDMQDRADTRSEWLVFSR